MHHVLINNNHLLQIPNSAESPEKAQCYGEDQSAMCIEVNSVSISERFRFT